MNTFKLESVSINGKSYDSCTLVLDVQAKSAQILRKSGLVAKKDVLLLALAPEQFPSAKVSGKEVAIGTVTLMAKDEASATEIGKTVMALAPPPPMDTAGILYKSAAGFLLERGAVVGFLSNYSTSPRAALFAIAKVWSGKGVGPVQEFLEKAHGDLSANLEKVKTAGSQDSKNLGDRNLERISAFTYAVGKIQDSFLGGGKGGEGSDLLKDLGVTEPVRGDGVEKFTETVLESAQMTILTRKPDT